VTEERRAHPRTKILVVTELDAAQQPSAIGLILDVSPTGARLLTAARVAIGDHVDLTLHLGLGGPTIQLGGEVVRAEALPLEDRGPWTHTLAVHFEKELTGYDAELARLSENAKKLGD
jgi:hypothetical protein